jgi:hypothetical protein
VLPSSPRQSLDDDEDDEGEDVGEDVAVAVGCEGTVSVGEGRSLTMKTVDIMAIVDAVFSPPPPPPPAIVEEVVVSDGFSFSAISVVLLATRREDDCLWGDRSVLIRVLRVEEEEEEEEDVWLAAWKDTVSVTMWEFGGKLLLTCPPPPPPPTDTNNEVELRQGKFG